MTVGIVLDLFEIIYLNFPIMTFYLYLTS